MSSPYYGGRSLLTARATGKSLQDFSIASLFWYAYVALCKLEYDWLYRRVGARRIAVTLISKELEKSPREYLKKNSLFVSFDSGR